MLLWSLPPRALCPLRFELGKEMILTAALASIRPSSATRRPVRRHHASHGSPIVVVAGAVKHTPVAVARRHVVISVPRAVVSIVVLKRRPTGSVAVLAAIHAVVPVRIPHRPVLVRMIHVTRIFGQPGAAVVLRRAIVTARIARVVRIGGRSIRIPKGPCFMISEVTRVCTPIVIAEPLKGTLDTSGH